ncbi:MAG: class I SAM-dependent methyltransferase [Chloroflexi bacterium]|nr:class I SAM-dependent methyltransferase [Chloroflexota bacterium]
MTQHHEDHEHDGSLPEGVYDYDYYVGRHRNRQLVYRLRRRTDEVARAIRKYGDGRLATIVDVGTADGLMLENLRKRFSNVRFVGLDRSLSLLSANPAASFSKVFGDAEVLPFATACADVVIATAVVEHLPHPNSLAKESSRVLRPGGLLVMTTPEPFMERLASKVGLLKDSGHQHTFDLNQLCAMIASNGMTILDRHKFMFSPIGFPAEKVFERVFGPLGLRLIMANQFLVARRG